ncbi:MAG: GTP 3',8-cyclase MoaA [Ruaniaceae bacterium]|nr:GTP 3',8-cyclase MoaA [Ruaniaceae bacterium]
MLGSMPVMVKLSDRYGRLARDLRVSLTDRCNLRCTYCMPAEGLPWIPGEEVLTDGEISRLLRIAVEMLGITKIRFTGGEPLLRKGLEGIIEGASALSTAAGQPPELSLTTNGLGLDKRLDSLVSAGLNRVNISLDSLDSERYFHLSRRDRLGDVLRAIDAVDAAGLHPLKINSVVMRGENEQDVVPLATFAISRGYELRFIEQMPLGPAHEWDRQRMVGAQEILDQLGAAFAIAPLDQPRGAAPAQLFSAVPHSQDGDEWGAWRDRGSEPGRIGVIASVTQPFCTNCDRARITSDGQVRSCLFSRVETDLRGPLRGGASDSELAELWALGHWVKPRSHGIDSDDFEPPQRTMSAIGG